MVLLRDANRAATFNTNFWNGPDIHEMASIGFIQVAAYTSQCVFCNIRISDWKESDSPLIRHVVAAGQECDFLTNYPELSDSRTRYDWSDLLDALNYMEFEDWCTKVMEAKTQ